MKKAVVLFTDGGTKNNGQVGKQESIICCVFQHRVLFLENIGDKTNNEAELTAILKALSLTSPKKFATVFTDSQLAENLINKKWLTDKEHLLVILRQIWLLERKYEIRWIPREQNIAGHIIEERYGI